MVLNDPITTGSTSAGMVTLQPFTVLQNIDLGTNPSAGNLGLAQGDLNHVTAGILRIGSTTAGNITNTAAITDAGTGWTTLSLITNGALLAGTNGSLTTTNLALQARNGIGSTANPILIAVTALAAFNSTDEDIDVTSISATGLTLNGAPVDGVTNVINGAVAGNLTLTTVDQSAAGQDLNLSAAAVVQANGGNIALRAGDNLSLGLATLVRTSGAGIFTFDIDFGTNVDPGAGATATLHGASLQGAAEAFLVGGNQSDTFNIDSITSVPITVDGGDDNSVPTATLSVTVNGSTISQTDAVGNVVNVDDTSSKASGLFYSLNTNAIQSEFVGAPSEAPLGFTNVQTVNLTTSTHTDTVSVVGSSAVFSSITNTLGNSVRVFATAANSATRINGSTAGLDCEISGTGAGSVLQAKGSTQSNFFVVASTGANSGVELDGNTAADGFDIAATGNQSLLALVSNGGNDIFAIGNNGTLASIQGKVGVTGATTGFATLFVNDQKTVANNLNYFVSANTFTRQDLANFQISFQQVQDLEVLGARFGGSGSDNVMYLTGQAVGSFIGLFGNGGNYAFSVLVSSTSGYNGVMIDGRSGSNNELFVTDTSGGAVNHNFAKAAGTLGTVFTTYPNKVGSKPSVVQHVDIENVFLNPNNG